MSFLSRIFKRKVKNNINKDNKIKLFIGKINNLLSEDKYIAKSEYIHLIDEFKDKVIVEVKDNGIGIKEENLEKIFDKFYQEDASHNSEGNGLGLAIVSKIIELHKGSIEVKSKVGEGTSFIVTIPKTKS